MDSERYYHLKKRANVISSLSHDIHMAIIGKDIPVLSLALEDIAKEVTELDKFVESFKAE